MFTATENCSMNVNLYLVDLTYFTRNIASRKKYRSRMRVHVRPYVFCKVQRAERNSCPQDWASVTGAPLRKGVSLAFICSLSGNRNSVHFSFLLINHLHEVE